MTTNPSLDVQLREVFGKEVKHLRHHGWTPGTVYGKGFEPVSVQMEERSFTKFYRSVGRTTLIDLNIPGHGMQSAFVHEVQRHPVSRDIIHAEFLVVDLKVEITAEIQIVLHGTSTIIERGDAIPNQSLATLTVRALPSNIPSQIDVDISVLDDLEKSIYVRDLPTTPDYEILSEGDELIVGLTQTRKVAAEAAEEEEAAAGEEEPELIRKEREEEGEGSE